MRLWHSVKIRLSEQDSWLGAMRLTCNFIVYTLLTAMFPWGKRSAIHTGARTLAPRRQHGRARGTARRREARAPHSAGEISRIVVAARCENVRNWLTQRVGLALCMNWTDPHTTARIKLGRLPMPPPPPPATRQDGGMRGLRSAAKLRLPPDCACEGAGAPTRSLWERYGRARGAARG